MVGISLPIFVHNQSNLGLLYTILIVVALVVQFYAMSRQLRQAGYASIWSLIPFLPLIVTISIVIWERFLIHSVVKGHFPRNTQAHFLLDLWQFDLVVLAISWVFFLVFALLKWPVARTAERVLESRFTVRSASEPTSGLIASVADTPSSSAPRMRTFAPVAPLDTSSDDVTPSGESHPLSE